MNNMVMAVVVTYNRLELLKKAIDALKAQTYTNMQILVVNNGSTDGTRAYLDACPGITVIHQDNCGGAGGFHAGMKHAMEQTQAGWVLLMDDDGIPAPDQVEKLVNGCVAHGLKVANALVVDINDENSLVMDIPSLGYPGNMQPVYPDFIFPFNGTFISREVIEKIGYIKREMFIWGDEREYFLRMKANSVPMGIVTAAIHRHPRFKGDITRVLPFHKSSIVIKPRGMDLYLYRNLGYIDKVYGQKNGLKYVVYYLSRLKFASLRRFLRVYRMGRRDDFSRRFT